MKEDIPAILEELNSGKAQILDIREDQEWEAGHLALASHFPLSEMDLGEDPAPEVDFNKKTYIYCRSGNRVRKARHILKAIGFSEVQLLQAGFKELKSAGAQVIENGDL